VQVNTTALESNISNIIYDIRRNPTVGDLQDDCVNFGMLRASKRCLIIILRRKSSNRKLGFRYKVNENTFRLRSSRRAFNFLPHSINSKLSFNQSVIDNYNYSVYYVYAA